jgi:hypothetical protein
MIRKLSILFLLASAFMALAPALHGQPSLSMSSSITIDSGQVTFDCQSPNNVPFGPLWYADVRTSCILLADGQKVASFGPCSSFTHAGCVPAASPVSIIHGAKYVTFATHELDFFPSLNDPWVFGFPNLFPANCQPAGFPSPSSIDLNVPFPSLPSPLPPVQCTIASPVAFPIASLWVSSTLTGITSASIVTTSVDPQEVTLGPSQQKVFTANNPVKWFINPPDVGTFSTTSTTATYTAPASIDSQQDITIKACSLQIPSDCAPATVTLMPIKITVDPPSADVIPGLTQNFTAAVQGSTATVTWSIATPGTTTGLIDSATGVYTAPSNSVLTGPRAVTIKACIPTGQCGMALVNVSPISIQVNGASPILALSGATQQFTATVFGTSNNAVTWAILPQGNTGVGSIDGNGLYKVPALSNKILTVQVSACLKAAVSICSPLFPLELVQPVSITNTAPTAFIAGGGPLPVNINGAGFGDNPSVFLGAAGFTPTTQATNTLIQGTVSVPALTGGTITSGSVTISISTVTDGIISSAQLLVPISPVTITTAVSPANINVLEGQQVQFVPVVTCKTANNLVCLVPPTAVFFLETNLGSITPDGLFTAPTSGFTTVTPIQGLACAVVNILACGPFVATVTPIGVSVSPNPFTATAGLRKQFTATLTNARALPPGVPTVTWSVSPPLGTIDSVSGIYTPPTSITSQQQVQVTACSTIDTSKCGQSAVTLAISVAPLISLSSTSLTFPDQSVGVPSVPQTVVLTNIGSAPLSITNMQPIGDFAVTNTCGGSVPAGAHCNINITFTPTATGPRAGTVNIISNDPNGAQAIGLSGNGTRPNAALSATSLSFADQIVGASSAAQTVTLTNNGPGTLAPPIISTSSDFPFTTTCTSVLVPGGTCTISITFHPTTTGTLNANLTVADNASNSPQTASLSGTGTGNPVDLSPPSLTFQVGQIVQTTSSAQTITLTNNTASPLVFTSIFATGIDFAASNTCVPSIAVHASCTINVTFIPSATGLRTATLMINDNAPNSPQTASLSGTGLPLVPVLTGIKPSTVTTGSSGFTLTVNGSSFAFDAVVQVNGSTRSTRFVSPFQLQATILASDLTGSQPLNITVLNPAPSGAMSTALPLTLTSSPIPLISNLTPPRVIECDPALSATPCPSFKLIVNGSFFPSGAQVQIDGTTYAATFISANQLTATILPADLTRSRFASIKVFNPTSGQLGANEAPLAVFRYGDLAFDNGVSANDLTVMANFLAGNTKLLDPAPGDLNFDGKTNITDLNILANFLAGNIHIPIIPDQTAILFNAGAPVNLSPPTFAGQMLGTTSEPLSLKLTNGGPTQLSISNVRIDPIGEFVVQSNGCGLSLAANASCIINVTFSPTAAGTHTAILTVVDNAGNSPQTATLSGTVISSAVPPTAALSSSLGITDGPVTLAFSSQTVGTNSALQRLRLINTSPTALSISGINIAPSGEFTESDDCGTSLAAGTSCNINVTFTPAASGTRTATLTVTDNASNSPQTANLTGVGGP